MFKKLRKALYRFRRGGVKFDSRQNHYSKIPMTKKCECCGTEDIQQLADTMRENDENCRLLGMSGEREAVLLAQIDGLKRENERLREALGNIGKHIMEVNQSDLPPYHPVNANHPYIMEEIRQALNRNKHLSLTIDPSLPSGEAHFKDKAGNVLSKIVDI